MLSARSWGAGRRGESRRGGRCRRDELREWHWQFSDILTLFLELVRETSRPERRGRKSRGNASTEHDLAQRERWRLCLLPHIPNSHLKHVRPCCKLRKPVRGRFCLRQLRSRQRGRLHLRRFLLRLPSSQPSHRESGLEHRRRWTEQRRCQRSGQREGACSRWERRVGRGGEWGRGSSGRSGAAGECGRSCRWARWSRAKAYAQRDRRQYLPGESGSSCSGGAS